MSGFKEFHSFSQMMRYLKKRGAEPADGSNAKNNYKFLFERKDKDNLAIGVVITHCPFCNATGDGGGISMIKKDSDDYQRAKSGKVEDMMCADCMRLSGYISNSYGLSAQEVSQVFEKIREIKEAREH